MIAFEHPYAGMILPDASDLDPSLYLDAATTALTRHEKGARPHRDPARSRVTGGRFSVQVHPEEDSDYGPRMVFSVSANGVAEADGGQEERAARILSDCVLLALKSSQADIVEWYSPDVLIDRDEFIRLRSYVSPRRNRPAPTRIGHAPRATGTEAQAETAPPACATKGPVRVKRPVAAQSAPRPRPAATAKALAAERPITLPETPPERAAQAASLPQKPSAFPPSAEETARTRVLPAFEPETLAPEPPESRRMQCAGWLMTGAVGVFSLPVAVSLSVFGLLRGMDFRLVAQVTAVTALFVVLCNTDRLHMVIGQLLH